MEETDPVDPELIDLTVQLCTRIGMIMEDVSPVALNASPANLEDRVREVATAIQSLSALASAVEVLLAL